MKESTHISFNNLAEETKNENQLIKESSFVYENKTPFHLSDKIDPIFGPKIKNNVEESPSSEFFTCFLSICNMTEKMKFLRKVYIIYSLQILLPLIASLLSYIYSISFYIMNNHWIIWLNIAITCITAIPLLLFPRLSKIDNLNLIILFVLSISVSILFMAITIEIGPTFTLFLGSNVICSICMIVSTYFITKDDYLCYELVSLISSIILLYFIIIALIIDIQLNNLAFSILISCIYLIFIFSDTYIILEVTSNKYSIDDYIMVSMILYTDAVMIIFFLLSKLFERKLASKQN